MRAVAFPLCCERVSGPRSQKEKGVITSCHFVAGKKKCGKKIRNKLLLLPKLARSPGDAPGRVRGQAVLSRGVMVGKGLALSWPVQTRGGSGEDFIWQMGAAIELMQ